MNAKQVLTKATQSNVKLVSFMCCDNAGIIRAKACHTHYLEDRMRSGISLPKAVQASTVTDQLLPIPELVPSGEVRLVPDPDTFNTLPYAPTRAAMTADMATAERQPWDGCPRTFLKRTLQEAEQMGLHFRAAFEPEWYLLRQVRNRIVPIDQSLDNSTIGDASARVIVDQVVDALDKQGIQVEQAYSELGNGQQEITIAHTPALRAADNQITYRETVRNVAQQHGYIASFAPKPFRHQAGSGCHIHISAWDKDYAKNLFHDGHQRNGLSNIAQHFMAGVMEHLPALLALTAPSHNSYLRLQPGWWSASHTCYGPDNREAAVRIPSTFAHQPMESTNLEYRPADSSANPYIALAGLITAGLDGIRQHRELNHQQETTQDPASIPERTREERSIARLPQTIREAADLLEKDQVLTHAMTPSLAKPFLAVRRAEHDAFASKTVRHQIRHHINKY